MLIALSPPIAGNIEFLVDSEGDRRHTGKRGGAKRLGSPSVQEVEREQVGVGVSVVPWVSQVISSYLLWSFL